MNATSILRFIAAALSAMRLSAALHRLTTLLVLGYMVNLLTADQFGDFTYTSSGSAVTITGYTGAGGAVSIPDTITDLPVTGIGGYAFYLKTSLTTVTIPASVTSIGDGAFLNCSGLTTITVASGNPFFSSVDGVLFDAARTTLIRCPGAKTGAYTLPGGVTHIADGAFAGCVNLTSISIPSGVTSIGNSTFRFCTRLQGCSIPATVTNIGSSAFQGCARLENITLPAGVTRIEDSTFSGCRNLVSAVIPTGVTTIGSYAFESCTSLNSINIPPGVTAIGQSAFSDCDSLKNVMIPASVTQLAGAFDRGGIASILVAADNPAYSSMDGVLFNKSRTILMRCPAAKPGAYDIPSGVTRVSFDAFADCANLTSVAIPASVTDIQFYAFPNCRSLVAITVDAANPSYSSVDGVLFDKNQSSLIQCPGGKTSAFTLPATVSNIEWEAFIGNSLAAINAEASNASFSSIEGILFDPSQTVLIQYPGGRSGPFTVPPEITDLGGIPVDDCNELTAISVDPAHALYRSVDGVLFNKNLTRLVRFPAGRGGSYTIPAGVTSIGKHAFDDCRRLTDVTIPASVVFIEYQAFRWCSSLGDVYFEGNTPVSEAQTQFLGSTAVTVYYLPGTKGWGPEYDGVPTAVIDESIYPAAVWLLAHGLDYDTDLRQDLNGDGVSLLLAYALDLDPNDNLAGRMPKPVLEAGTMTLTFHAASPGITYAVQSSTDLRTWVTDGVSVSELAPDNTRTATVDRLSPVRFLRLVVTD